MLQIIRGRKSVGKSNSSFVLSPLLSCVLQPDQGHTYLDTLRDAYALVQPFDQAGTDRSTAFGGGREYRGASLPACQEWARAWPWIK
jgi:hypothetical protein